MKKAFSLFELVTILLILGVLLSTTLPSLKPDKLSLGARQIANDLNYLRFLALTQSAFKPYEFSELSNKQNDEWYKGRWTLYFNRSNFTNNELSYSLFVDKNGDGNANKGGANTKPEMASDIINPMKFMNYGQSGVLNAGLESDAKMLSKRFNIEREFGITKAELKGACAGTGSKISFDEFGRVFTTLTNASNEFDRLVILKNEDCIIKLSTKQNSLCIVLDKLSGSLQIPPFTSPNTQLLKFKNQLVECAKI